MKTLYYLSYNNYYNRLLKRRENVTEYLSDGAIPCGESFNVNFFPNDGITTTHTPYLNDLHDIPDYVLVMDQGMIESRWFVIECRYNTGKNQYVCSLYRDLIAEYWPQIVDKPFYCEKGWLSVIDNGIFNDEAITTSQIKSKEFLLTDSLAVPWVVGYYAPPKADDADKTITYNSIEISPDYEVESLSDWTYYNQNINFCNDWNLNYVYKRNRLIYSDEVWTIPFKTQVAGTPEETSSFSYGNWNSELSPSNFASYLGDALQSSSYQNLQSVFASHANVSFDNSVVQRMKTNEGAIIKERSTGKYYEVYLKTESTGQSFTEINPGSTLGTTMKNIILTMSSMHQQANFNGTINSQNLRYRWSGVKYTYGYKAALLDKGNIKIRKTRRLAYDAPYSIFCMPYADLYFGANTDNLLGVVTHQTFATTQMNAINIASAIAAQTGNACYDIQLLPYCPIREIREAGEIIGPFYFDIAQSNLIEGQDYEIAKDDNGMPTQILFWLDKSSDQFTVESPIDNYKTENLPTNSIDFKVGNQTEFIRLCSPNYNGVFEMNPYKNRGIDYFTISYTYKPFQPFIHVKPNFKGLYGSDFKDSRGLILGGDFSLPTTSDTWKNYEIQNKNYQVMFNRQIENMEVQHKYQRREQLANAITGSISGGATGAMAGGMAGGVWGAVAGAAVGTITSTVGGVLDYQAGNALRAEALDYSKDMFGYQLDNIKALPISLTRISAFNINNKIFPFIEVYDCSAEEKEAVRNKIIYNGMTIERIGTIDQFAAGQNPYIKGKLIRFEGVTEDSHTITTLSNELNKGVFVK